VEGSVGGVGGLLWQRRGGKDLLSLYDGHGQITGLYDAAAGQVTARYSYGPFGEALRASGPDAQANPFRWSTKYTDSELGLTYYGFRDYRPDLGRWLSRDPLGEIGGFNLYGFIGNDGINKSDVLGLYETVLSSMLNTVAQPFFMIQDITTVSMIWTYNQINSDPDSIIYSEHTYLNSNLARQQLDRLNKNWSPAAAVNAAGYDILWNLASFGGYGYYNAAGPLINDYNNGLIDYDTLKKGFDEITGSLAAEILLAKLTNPEGAGNIKCKPKSKPNEGPEGLTASEFNDLLRDVGEPTTTLYHGGALKDINGNPVGSLVDRRLSTTTSREHASKYAAAAEGGGQIHEFKVPTRKLNEWLETMRVQEIRDTLTGKPGSATEYRFSPGTAPELNNYRVSPPQ
jgi:RHS repeat-associated protein